MRGRSCSGPQSRSCPQDTCVWSISLEERRNIYIFKTLCKHLAVQAERHWTAGLWWQWWVLVADQTEKQLDLFQRKRKNRSFKVYVSRVAILPVLPRWVPLSRCCCRAAAFGQEGWEFWCCASHSSGVWGAWDSLGLVGAMVGWVETAGSRIRI